MLNDSDALQQVINCAQCVVPDDIKDWWVDWQDNVRLTGARWQPVNGLSSGYMCNEIN